MSTHLTTDEITARYALLCRSTQVEATKDLQTRQINEHLQVLNKLLKHDLRALARRGSPHDFADIYFALEQELERFHEFCSFPALSQKIVVAFGGGFSAGKSSLINALLGKRLLVTEVDPTTSLPTYLLHGEHDAVHAHNLFGHRIDLSNEEFLSLTHDETERYGSNVSRLLRSAFITRADFPWSDLALIDTPGYTKHEDQVQHARTDEHIARTQLNAAQAIVWVIDARKGCITEDDLRFLATVQADIPRLIVVSRADQKPAEDMSAIVQGIKTTLSERNLPFMDVIAVSARKKQEWPMEPILAQLAAWSQQPRTLRFAHNFKAQFTHYARFIEEQQRSAQRHLNRLNRILVMAENEAVQADAEELKQQAQDSLSAANERAAELLELRHRFFSELKAVGDTVGIALPEPSEIDLLDTLGTDILKLLMEQREEEGRSTPDEPQKLRDLMNEGETTKLSCLLGNGLEGQLSRHRASELDIHSRETYARLLAAILTAQGAVTEAQSELFKALLGTLELDDIRNRIFTQIKDFNHNELDECYRIIQENELSNSALLDVLILCRLGQPLKEVQVQLIAEIAEYLEIEKYIFLEIIGLTEYVLGFVEDDSLFEGDLSEFSAWGTLIPITNVEDRISLAKRINLPANLQSKLILDRDEKVVSALAANSCLHEELQSELAKNGSSEVREIIAENPCLKEDLQNYLFSTGSEEIKRALAKNMALIIQIQVNLSMDSSWRTRFELAKNISIQQEILVKLAEDSDIDVRAAVAGNPSISKDLQKKMIKDELKVRKSLASNSSLSNEFFSELATAEETEVRELIARNLLIDEIIQAKLAQDCRGVQQSLALNESLAVAQQFELLKQDNLDIKINLFKNPSLNESVKEKLIASISSYDADYAKTNFDYCEKLKESAWDDYKKATNEYFEYAAKMSSFWFSQDKLEALDGKVDFENKYYDLKSKDAKDAEDKIYFIQSILDIKNK